MKLVMPRPVRGIQEFHHRGTEITEKEWLTPHRLTASVAQESEIWIPRIKRGMTE